MTKLTTYIKLMRPINLLQGAIAVIVTATLMEQFPKWWKIILAIVIVGLYTGAGNALNDYYDSEIDKINRPNRPISKGLIKRRESLIFSICLFIVGSLLALAIWNWQIGVILLISLILLISYSAFFKMKPLLGNAVVATMLGMAFIFSAMVFGNILKGVIPALLAFGFTIIREIIKDMEDLEGDKSLGANTFPIKYGVDSARKLTSIFTVILMFGAFLPFILNIYGIFYFLVLTFTVEIPLVYVLYSLQRDTSAENCARLSSILKGDIFFGLLAIFLGRY